MPLTLDVHHVSPPLAVAILTSPFVVHLSSDTPCRQRLRRGSPRWSCRSHRVSLAHPASLPSLRAAPQTLADSAKQSHRTLYVPWLCILACAAWQDVGCCASCLCGRLHLPLSATRLPLQLMARTSSPVEPHLTHSSVCRDVQRSTVLVSLLPSPPSSGRGQLALY